jgi:hypothetical protein
MSASTTDVGLVVFEWSLERGAGESEAGDVADRIRASGGQAEVVAPPAGIVPLAIPFIIFGAIALVGLGEQVWEWWENRKKRGLLVQVDEHGKLTIKELNIPYGQVVILSPDGTTVTHKDVTKDKLAELLDAATKAVTGGDDAEGTGDDAAPAGTTTDTGTTKDSGTTKS